MSARDRDRSPPLHAVVMAGGAGERFWPASRRHYPKPFLRVVGGETLLEATLDRARRFVEEDNIWIVCGQEHARAIREESGLRPARILVEPERRNTAMAAAWASIRIQAEAPDAVLAVLSADHHIPDADGFAEAIRSAAVAASGEGVLVTLGVRPSRPDTGYGYIQQGPAVGDDYPGLHRVKRFVEKPNAARARTYLARGGYLWNAGVFVWSVGTLLAEIEQCAPELYRALSPLLERPRGRNRGAVLETYRDAPSLPIDVAVMEVSRKVWTIPVNFVWSDVGTWSSLAEQLGVGRPATPTPSGNEASSVRQRRARGKRAGRGDGARREAGTVDRAGGPRGDAAGNRVLAGDVLLEDARANFVWAGERLIALLGVDDLAVIDTDDVILITKLERSPDVRRIVAALKAQGRDDLT